MYGAARERRQALGNIPEEEEQDPRDMYRFRTNNFAVGQGQSQGPAQAGQDQTPPGQQQDSAGSQDRTPSAKAKVLPWVEGIEEGSIPDGMFGPYDSLPPTRMPTMHEQPRSHPFAFTTSGPSGTHDSPPAVPSKEGMSPRKASPKKAATQLTGSPRRASPTRSAPHPLPVEGDIPAPRSAISRKPVPAVHDQLPSKTPTQTQGNINNSVPAMTTGGKGHHEHAFSHQDAARQQAEAMEIARAQALAQLHHAQAQVQAMEGMDDEIPADLARAMGSLGMIHGQGFGHPGPAGARGTYDTGTSGPSFGHLYHDGAQPTSARQSVQQPRLDQVGTGAGMDDGEGEAGGHAMMRDMAAYGGQQPGSFVRVPFGVPLSMQLPRPMMVMRTPTGMAMGIGVPQVGIGAMGLGMVPPGIEHAERDKRDDRSAYVETVDDEDSPTAKTHAKTHKTQRTTVPPTTRTEKTHDKMANQSAEKSTAGAKSTMGGLPRGFDPETYPPPAVSHKPKEKAKTRTHVSESPSRGTAPLDTRSKAAKSTRPPVSAAHKSHKAPSERSALGATLDVLEAQQASRRSLGVRSEVDGASIASDARTGDNRSSNGSERTVRPPPSAAPTTASNIKRLVSDSGVHDEELCQLLDGAKLNLLGSIAKKALQRAARARVIELRDRRETEARAQAALMVKESESAKSRDSAKEPSVKADSMSIAPTAASEAGDVPAPASAASIAASRHAARSQAAASRHAKTAQGSLEHRTDISPKTKVRGPATETPKAPTADQPSPAGQNDVDPYGTPRWAKSLQHQMADLGDRFNELRRQTDALGQQQYGALTPSGDGVSPGLLQKLMFGGFPGGPAQMSYFALPSAGASGMHVQAAHIEQQDSPQSTKIREIPSTRGREQSGGDVTLTWGSEVELPSGTGSPTKATQAPAHTYGAPSTVPRGPIINVHPPTESNARTRAASIPSRTDPRTPAAQTVQLQQDEPETGMTGMAEVDKSLPSTPETERGQPMRSAVVPAGDDARVGTASPPSVEYARHAPSIAQVTQPGYGGYPYEKATTAPTTMPDAYATTVRDGTMQDSATSDTLPTPTGHYPAVLGAPIPATATTARTQPGPMRGTAPSRTAMSRAGGIQQPFTPITEQQSAMTADAVTAPTHITRPSQFSQPAAPQSPAQRGQYAATRPPAAPVRDIIRIREAAPQDEGSRDGLEPWESIVQRLYQWAMVWEEDSFTKALEGMALGKQIEALGLTVFMMMVYKRLVSHHLTAEPPQVCDKLFVPPIIAEAINQAVHNKQFDSAGAMLEELWYPYGFKKPPRVIIALAKHRKDADKWTAHRFDLSSGNLTSYAVTSDEQNLPDGRPFMWWHAIRSAWPEYKIPDPDLLKQRVEYVLTDPEKSGDNSLKAMNYARNLLLGFRPELGRDLVKLREVVWNEVKRLLNKKRAGSLVVDAEHRHHAHL